MAKALYGHLSTPDPLLAAEVARLRGRVRELEAENALLREGLRTLSDELVAEAEAALA